MPTSKPRFVYLTDRSPHPPVSGGMIRDASWLRILTELGETTVLLSDSIAPRSPYRLKRLFSKFRSHPENGYHLEVEKKIKDAFTPGSTLILSRLVQGKYIESAKKIGYRVVLDEHNVESVLHHQISASLKKSRYRDYLNRRLEKIEEVYCIQADLVFCTSKDDAKYLEKWLSPKKIKIFPNTINPREYHSERSFAERSLILFAGTLDYYPNVDGLNWFIDKVLPSIRKKMPALVSKFVIAGRNPQPQLTARFKSESLKWVENPAEMTEIFSNTSLLFVPLKHGSGTRIKILEALASGCRVLSTRKGAEGFSFTSENGLWIEDHPERFADLLIKLAQDENSFPRDSRSAREAIEHFCNLKDWTLRLRNDLGVQS